MRLLLLSLVLLVGCDSGPFESDPLAAVEWGSSFGECSGYCRARLVVGLNGTATLTETGARLEPRVRSRPLTEAERTRLADALNASTVRTETRGCPDCADGGAEYVQRGGARTTFEYGGDAGAADPLARVLRAVRETFPYSG